MAEQIELWPVEHNWAADWTESYEFRTEILTPRDQSEQRIAERAKPRVTYEFRSTTRGERGYSALSRLGARHGQSWVVPHGRLSDTVSGAISAGTNGFTLVGDPDWAQVGLDLVFIRPDGTSEWGRIATYAASVGTLEDNVLVDIPDGALVRHGIRGRFTSRSQIRMHTTRHGTANLQFLAEPGQLFRPGTGAANGTYNGRPLWALRPNWASPPTLDYDQFVDVIDMGAGVRDYITPVDYVLRRVNANYLVKSQATQDALYGHFVRQLGQQKSFYMPSWVREFTPEAVTINDLTVAGTDVANLYATDPAHRHIIVFKTDGTSEMAEVSSIVVASGSSTISFVAPIGALALADIAYATWLLPVRHATDRLELNWVTGALSPVNLPVVTLRDDPFFGEP